MFLDNLSQHIESTVKECYLDDMLSVDGDADAAVENRIRIGQSKFRQLVPLLTNKDISLITRYAQRAQTSADPQDPDFGLWTPGSEA